MNPNSEGQGPKAFGESPSEQRETGIRLQKLLAQAGLGSRRTCEEMIAEGRVSVDGALAQLGSRADPATQTVLLDGVALPLRPGLVHYLLNKPAGVVSTVDDPEGRAKVVDLVPAEPRVFPVGRLDAATEGLLIITNDGDLTHALTHPSKGVEKEYLVQVEGRIRPGQLRQLRTGVQLDDGITAPAKAALGGDGLLRLVIHEGRNRQVRRMCAAVGHPVERLVRVRIGPLSDRSLAPGEFRTLSFDEVLSLTEAAAGKPQKGPN